MDLGLHRVQALLQRVGTPQAVFPVIHVAGTNGKGSTTAYMDALLTHAAGLRAARFNSPHLVSPRDCVRVGGGEPIDEHTWARARERVHAADAAAAICATPFELLTAQALVAFTLLPDNARPHVLVIEVGVGGRFDATNVFPRECILASVICPIAHDHERLLGHGLTAITREKAGIIKDGGLCVIADQAQAGAAHPEVAAALREACAERGARVAQGTIPWAAMHVARRAGGASARFALRLAPTAGVHGPQPPTIPLELECTHARIVGCTTALQTLWSIAYDAPGTSTAAAAHVRASLRRMFEQDSRIHAALARYRWEGRCEWITLGTTTVLLDGAHNEASAAALRRYLDDCGHRDMTWVMAISQGKAAGAMFDALFRNGRHRVAFVPFSAVEDMPWVRPLSPAALAAQVRAGHWPVDDVRAFDSLDEALAWTRAAPHVVVCGSLYLVSDFYRSARASGSSS